MAKDLGLREKVFPIDVGGYEETYENDCLSKERLLELVTEANQAFFFNKPQQETERVNDRFRLEGGGLKANE